MQSIRNHYSDDDVVVWLINPEDDLDEAFGFVGDAGVDLPVLLDPGGSNYRGYPIGGEVPYGPYPLQVVIDADGVIRYLARQHDPTALRATVDGLLDGP